MDLETLELIEAQQAAINEVTTFARALREEALATKTATAATIGLLLKALRINGTLPREQLDLTMSTAASMLDGKARELVEMMHAVSISAAPSAPPRGGPRLV